MAAVTEASIPGLLAHLAHYHPGHQVAVLQHLVDREMLPRHLPCRWTDADNDNDGGASLIERTIAAMQAEKHNTHFRGNHRTASEIGGEAARAGTPAPSYLHALHDEHDGTLSRVTSAPDPLRNDEAAGELDGPESLEKTDLMAATEGEQMAAAKTELMAVKAELEASKAELETSKAKLKASEAEREAAKISEADLELAKEHLKRTKADLEAVEALLHGSKRG